MAKKASGNKDSGWFCTLTDRITRKMLGIVFFMDDGRIQVELRYPQRYTGGAAGQEARYLVKAIVAARLEGEDAIRMFAARYQSGLVGISHPRRLT